MNAMEPEPAATNNSMRSIAESLNLEPEPTTSNLVQKIELPSMIAQRTIGFPSESIYISTKDPDSVAEPDQSEVDERELEPGHGYTSNTTDSAETNSLHCELKQYVKSRHRFSFLTTDDKWKTKQGDKSKKHIFISEPWLVVLARISTVANTVKLLYSEIAELATVPEQLQTTRMGQRLPLTPVTVSVNSAIDWCTEAAYVNPSLMVHFPKYIIPKYETPLGLCLKVNSKRMRDEEQRGLSAASLTAFKSDIHEHFPNKHPQASTGTTNYGAELTLRRMKTKKWSTTYLANKPIAECANWTDVKCAHAHCRGVCWRRIFGLLWFSIVFIYSLFTYIGKSFCYLGYAV